jgi:hypothetical protein
VKKHWVYALLTLTFAASASASLADHWQTADQCLMATDAPFYYPTIKRNLPLGPNEVIRGHPTGGCFEMELPDRLGNRGWVKIDKDREFVYDTITGLPKRLAECNNDVYNIVPFPPVKGEKGDKGEDGLDGINCWDTNNNGRNDPNEDANGDGVFNSDDCRGKDGEDGDDCEIYKTRGVFLHHTFKKCGDEKAQVIDRGLRGWVIPAAVVVGAATGGALAAPLCVTIESAVGVGALTGATLATATNVVVEDLPAPTRSIADIMK